MIDAQAETGRSGRSSWPPSSDSDASASPGYGGYQAAALHGEPGHFLDYVRVVYRRRYTAITAFLVILVAVVVYTYTRTPIYQARAQLQIDYENQKVVPFQEVTQREMGWDTSEYLPDSVQDPAEPQPRQAHARFGEPLDAPSVRRVCARDTFLRRNPLPIRRH